jgi:hypothetical protein
MKLNSWQKNILSMLVIIGVSFVLFNVAFVLAYFVNTMYNILIMPFINKADSIRAIHFSWHYLYLILIFILSWFVLRRPLKDLVKATFFTLPLVIALTEVGIQFYSRPALVWIINAVIIGSALFYFYKRKYSWLYYFATIYVTVIEIFVFCSGMQI